MTTRMHSCSLTDPPTPISKHSGVYRYFGTLIVVGFPGCG
jgi:hypothetical protein